MHVQSQFNDPVTLPLRKHVFVPNVQGLTLDSLPEAYWTVAMQVGGRFMAVTGFGASKWFPSRN